MVSSVIRASFNLAGMERMIKGKKMLTHCGTMNSVTKIKLLLDSKTMTVPIWLHNYPIILKANEINSSSREQQDNHTDQKPENTVYYNI